MVFLQYRPECEPRENLAQLSREGCRKINPDEYPHHHAQPEFQHGWPFRFGLRATIECNISL